jgi:hypothetical protein
VHLEGVYSSIPLFLHNHIYHLSFPNETFNSFKGFDQDIDFSTVANTTALELTIYYVLFFFFKHLWRVREMANGGERGRI